MRLLQPRRRNGVWESDGGGAQGESEFEEEEDAIHIGDDGASIASCD